MFVRSYDLKKRCVKKVKCISQYCLFVYFIYSLALRPLDLIIRCADDTSKFFFLESRLRPNSRAP